MRYFLFAILSVLVVFEALFIAWLVRHQAWERLRLYSLAFANQSPQTVPHAVAMVNEEPVIAPMPARPPVFKNGEEPDDEFMEPVGGSF